ncbi:hypothetical protein D9758_018128 [Tetrapyrgos nigripes]|uniref:Uncharacterized protein n=1 Tax=Tetrapyrgos nigripes TaxID=182062 RepID=A0A8H5C5Y0_9AGAR|nr:hypothetical protein D9758_018128 [Tetrapyrgos nigripes]
MASLYSPQVKSFNKGRSEISTGDYHRYGSAKSPIDSERGTHSMYDHASLPALNQSADGRQRRKANAILTFYQSLSWTLGFKEKYSLLLFIVFGGALLGFCLARAYMMNTRIMREQTTPGDFRWFDQKMYKTPYFWHIYTTIIGGFIVGAQFLPVIRRQYILLHRMNGYLVVLLLIPGNIAGSIVARRSFGGEINQQSAYYLLGIMITFSMLMGLINVKKDTRTHRRWMLSMAQPLPHYYQSGLQAYTGGVVYFASPILPRPMILIARAIITKIGSYWSVWRCDEVLYVLQSTESLSQLFPQCAASGTDPSNNTLSVAVHASNHEGDLGKSSAARLVHGMCLWISMIICVLGVEIYCRSAWMQTQTRTLNVLTRIFGLVSFQGSPSNETTSSLQKNSKEDGHVSISPRIPIFNARLFALSDRVNYIVGDIIVVWRAWILFPGNLKIKMLLVLCLIASCGVFINGGRVIAYELKNLDASVPATNVLILAMPLFFTNLVVTVLIGYKTWMYQQDIRKNLINTSGSGPRLQKILLLLIESGMIYCILWMLDGLLGFSSTSSSISTRVLGSAMPNLAGIYPNLIILIAMLEYTQPANLEETSLSQSLRFATSASESESTSSSGRVRLRDSSIRVGSRRAREGGWESDGTNVVTNSAVEEENC